MAVSSPSGPTPSRVNPTPAADQSASSRASTWRCAATRLASGPREYSTQALSKISKGNTLQAPPTLDRARTARRYEALASSHWCVSTYAVADGDAPYEPLLARQR